MLRHIRLLFKNMSAGGGTMVCGNVLSTNKVAPANERTFTERNEAFDAPRSFEEARKNVGFINDTILNGSTQLRIQIRNAKRYLHRPRKHSISVTFPILK